VRAEDALLKGHGEGNSLVSQSEQGQASIPSEMNLDFVGNATLTRSITMQRITGLWSSRYKLRCWTAPHPSKWRIVDSEFLDTRSTTGFVNQRSDAEIPTQRNCFHFNINAAIPLLKLRETVSRQI